MRIYLVHHAQTRDVAEDPERHLSEEGRAQADRVAALMKADGAAPVRILHSERVWTRETAERIAAALGIPERTAAAEYPVATGDPVSPFLAEIAAFEASGADGDLMMAGHVDYLRRAASALLCGNEDAWVVEFKPGNGAAFCLDRPEGETRGWAVTWGWRQEQLAG